MKRLVLLLAVALGALAPAAEARPIEDGTIELAFDNTFGLALVQLGVAPTAVAPAVQDSVSFTLPVHRGTLTRRKALVRSRGGFNMTDAPQGIELTLTGVAARVRGRRVALQGFARLAGQPTNSFVFARGRAQRVRRDRFGLRVGGVTLRLTDIGVTSLNTQFFTDAFSAGQAIGSLRLSAYTTAR